LCIQKSLQKDIDQKIRCTFAFLKTLNLPSKKPQCPDKNSSNETFQASTESFMEAVYDPAAFGCPISCSLRSYKHQLTYAHGVSTSKTLFNGQYSKKSGHFKKGRIFYLENDLVFWNDHNKNCIFDLD